MILIFYISTLAVIATGCTILGFHILFRDRSSRINMLFFINSMLLNGVIAFTILIQLAREAQTANFIQSLYNIILIIFLLESLYFNLVFTGSTPGLFLKTVLGLYSGAIFIIFCLWGKNLLHLTKMNGLWVYELVNHTFWFFLYSPLLVLIVYIMLRSLHRYSMNALSNRERKQARTMMISILASCGAGFFFLMIFPALNIYRAPLLTPYFFAIYLYGVFVAITRYRFMISGIQDIASEALSCIQDAIIILDQNRKILDVNSNAAKMLGIKGDDMKGRYFKSLTENAVGFNSELDSIFKGRSGSVNCRIIYKSETENIITDSSISAVYDRFRDFVAVLIVSRVNKGIVQFKRCFRLTEREMEIITLTISGLTNIEIAAKLGITKRTVETHQNNIYNKLGVSNKIELLNITSEFGIKQF